MSNFGWVDSLVREPGVNIQRLTTRGQVVVIIKRRKYMAVFHRSRKMKGFCRVPKRNEEDFLQRIRQKNHRITGITI